MTDREDLVAVLDVDADAFRRPRTDIEFQGAVGRANLVLLRRGDRCYRVLFTAPLRRYLRRARGRLAGQTELLDSLSPLTVMKRGYGALHDSAGRLVRSVREVKAGDALKVRMRDGTLDAEVSAVHEEPRDN